MSSRDTDGGIDPERTNVDIRLTESFLADVDATWREEGVQQPKRVHPGRAPRRGPASVSHRGEIVERYGLQG